MAERRKFTTEFKAKVVLELISGEKGLMQASREYDIKDSVLSRWKQEFVERAPQMFETTKNSDPQADRIAELERMVGRLALQLDLAKKSSSARATHGRETSDGERAARLAWLPDQPGL
jgi:transposase